MRNIYSYITILLVGIAFNSCVDEKFEPLVPSYKEGEVIFSAASGFETDEVNTKTVYSGDIYNASGKTFERIEWENGDAVRIYCHSGVNKQSADYVVNTNSASANKQIHTAALYKHAEDNGIQWNGTEEHKFYAIYPSPTMPNKADSKTDLLGEVDITYDEATQIATLKGYVPTTQAPIEIVTDKAITVDGVTKRTADYWAKPDMRYSYMVASTEASPSDQGVALSFSAVATALEIEIIAAEATTISEIILQSKSGAPLTGKFTCPIDNNGKPITNDIVISEGASTVSIQLGAVPMETDETLRITALLLPINLDESDLNIIIQTDKLMVGNLGGVSLTAHKKHYLTNINLKKSEEVNGNNWITILPDNVIMRGLSIPATSNSFSYYVLTQNLNQSYEGTLDVSDASNTYVSQTKSFEEQWNNGVRCFEFVSDRNSSDATDVSVSIGSERLKCNTQDLGITFSDAFDRVAQKISSANGKDEFAMIICTYQPEGKTNIPRDPAAYMSQLKAFYNANKTRTDVNFVLYRPGLTIKDVRGSIMLVARPTQEGEDSDDVVSKTTAGSDYNILTVQGWGSLPDKWWRRGYEALLFKGAGTSGEISDKRESIQNKNLPAVEDWIYGASGYAQGIVDPFYPYATGEKSESLPEPGDIRFEYPTDNSNFNVWAQEWRRVVKEDVTISGRIPTLWYVIGTQYTNYNYRFFKSIDEKEKNIKDTFEKSISDKEGKLVYFNSLSGYYMLTDNSEASYKSFGPYWMGNLGDIGSYSTHINDYFDGVIEDKGEANITGPMGVVIMDRVGETQSSIDLARIIIANNFKFKLPTAE